MSLGCAVMYFIVHAAFVRIKLMMMIFTTVLFNTIADTNHNANPTNPNRNSKGSPNPTNPNTRYRCEYGTLNSMFVLVFSNTVISFLAKK